MPSDPSPVLVVSLLLNPEGDTEAGTQRCPYRCQSARSSDKTWGTNDITHVLNPKKAV